MRRSRLTLLSLLAPALFACADSATSPAASDASDIAPSALTFQGTGPRIYGVDTQNRLLVFSANPGNAFLDAMTITGLVSPGEFVVGIDFGPQDHLLYAISNWGRVYTLNRETAAATQVGTDFIRPEIKGMSYGVDFNPVVNRIRVHSNRDQNLRINQLNGTLVAFDGTLIYADGDVNFGANPSIVGTAYTNSLAVATTTTLYAIDSDLDILTILPSPNTGVLSTVGSLGVNTGLFAGFDIDGSSNVAYAALSTLAGGRSALYTINLGTGAATLVKAIGGAEFPLVGIAITP